MNKKQHRDRARRYKYSSHTALQFFFCFSFLSFSPLFLYTTHKGFFFFFLFRFVFLARLKTVFQKGYKTGGQTRFRGWVRYTSTTEMRMDTSYGSSSLPVSPVGVFVVTALFPSRVHTYTKRRKWQRERQSPPRAAKKQKRNSSSSSANGRGPRQTTPFVKKGDPRKPRHRYEFASCHGSHGVSETSVQE